MRNICIMLMCFTPLTAHNSLSRRNYPSLTGKEVQVPSPGSSGNAWAWGGWSFFRACVSTARKRSLYKEKPKANTRSQCTPGQAASVWLCPVKPQGSSRPACLWASTLWDSKREEAPRAWTLCSRQCCVPGVPRAASDPQQAHKWYLSNE